MYKIVDNDIQVMSQLMFHDSFMITIVCHHTETAGLELTAVNWRSIFFPSFCTRFCMQNNNAADTRLRQNVHQKGPR